MSSFEGILAKIAEVPLKKAFIQLNTQAIHFRSLSTSQQPSKVKVEIQDSEAQVFDDLVVTTPLGWLKRNKSAFEPPLDGELERSIDAISIGHLEKVATLPPLKFLAIYGTGSGVYYISQSLLENISR